MNQQKTAGYEGFHPYQCDITNWDECVALKQQMESDGVGAVDILVNNAGITRDARFVKMTPQMWDEVINTNLSGVFYVSKQFVDGMAERGFGRVINISSINAQKGSLGRLTIRRQKPACTALPRLWHKRWLKKVLR